MRTEGRQHGARSLLTAEKWMNASIQVQSHQRSWWIVHTRPTTRLRRAFSGIPPTQLVDRSYPAYNEAAARLFWNPTNAVGGSFILGLHRAAARLFWNPANAVGGLFILSLQRGCGAPFAGIPPTQLVDCSYPAYNRNRKVCWD